MPSPDPGSPPTKTLPFVGRLFLGLLRIVGVVVVIGCVLGIKAAAAKNPSAAAAIGGVLVVGLLLAFGSARLVKVMMADAQQERPSRGLGALKLGLGLVLMALACVSIDLKPPRLGLFNAVPYGVLATLPYAAAIGIGAVGVLGGLFSLVGKRPGLIVNLLVGIAVAGGLAIGLPAASPVRFMAEVVDRSANMFGLSADGKVAFVQTGGGSGASEIKGTIVRLEPFAHIGAISLQGVFTIPMALSPDGSRLAVVKKDRLLILDSATGRELANQALADLGDGTGVHLRYSTDGSKLLIAISRSTYRDVNEYYGAIALDAAGVELKRLPLTKEAGKIHFSPDGRQVATVQVEGKQISLQVRNFESGQVAAKMEFTTPYEEKRPRILWSPDSQRLLISSIGVLVLFKATGGEPVWRVEVEEVYDIAFHGDSRRLLASLHDNRLLLLDAENGNVLAKVSSFPAYRLAWNADGTRLLTSYIAGTTELWDVSRLLEP